MNKEFVGIQSIKSIGEKPVADISVEGNHNFIVDNGYVVHNCVYQEQIMKIMNVVGLISLPDCEKIRKALGKKKRKDFAIFKDQFVANAKSTVGWTKKEASDYWDQMEDFSTYGFNLCITKDSVVETKEGYKLAAEAKKGDVIKSYNPDKQEMFWDTIAVVHDNGVKTVYEIELDNGCRLECTLDHELVCEDGKKRKLKEILQKNLKVIAESGEKTKQTIKQDKTRKMLFRACNIVATECKGEKPVLDLQMTSRFHNFLANRIVVGNSHACSYTLITMRCMHLREYYPAQYFAAVLSCLNPGDARIEEYMREAKHYNVIFKPVHINYSKTVFNLADRTVYFGFSKVKGVGKSAPKLVELQPFSSFEDYLKRFGLAKTTGQALIKLGAFDDFCRNRAQLLAWFEEERNQKGKKKQQEYSLKDFADVKPFTGWEEIQFEMEHYGIYFNHPLSLYAREGCTIKKATEKTCTGEKVHAVKVEGIITGINQKTTKNNKPYYVVQVSDDTGHLKLLLWENQHDTNSVFIKEGKAVSMLLVPPKAPFPTWNLTKGGIIKPLLKEGDTKDTHDDEFEEFLGGISEFATNKA